MKGLKILLIIAMLLACHPAFAVDVSICNQSQSFMEITDYDEILAEADTGECFMMKIREKEKLLITLGMTRYLFDFSSLKNCTQDGKAKLVASDEGKLYCDSLDQKQPGGFPLEAWRKIDLI